MDQLSALDLPILISSIGAGSAVPRRRQNIGKVTFESGGVGPPIPLIGAQAVRTDEKPTIYRFILLPLKSLIFGFRGNKLDLLLQLISIKIYDTELNLINCVADQFIS